MSQLHIRTEAENVAPIVLLPGDPGRARYIAENFFEDARCYNDYRQLLGYTGKYNGVPVSVQTTGMGCPSLAITVEELIRLGAKTLVRVGTAGTIAPQVNPADLIIATASMPHEGTTPAYLQEMRVPVLPYTPHADFQLCRGFAASAEAQGFAYHAGLIQTVDAFYVTTPDHLEPLSQLGVLGVEMEASTLFTLAQLRGVRAGAVLVASNRIGDSSFIDPEILRASVDKMVTMVLESLTQHDE